MFCTRCKSARISGVGCGGWRRCLLGWWHAAATYRHRGHRGILLSALLFPLHHGHLCTSAWHIACASLNVDLAHYIKNNAHHSVWAIDARMARQQNNASRGARHEHK